MTHLKSSVLLLTCSLLVIATSNAHAGACLCLKSNGVEITEFTCTAQDGPNECGQHCAGADFPGSEYFGDETCQSLHEKIKREEIEVPIPKLTSMYEVVQLVDLTTGEVLAEQGVGSSSALLTESTIGPQSRNSGSQQLRARRGQGLRRVILARGEFLGGTDTFEVPETLGGGWSTTTAFAGSFDLRLVERIDTPDFYDVELTRVKTLVADLELGGLQTGVFRGSINPGAPNSGTYDAVTGKMSLLFSQFLVSDSFPDQPIMTYTTYSGVCVDCLASEKQFLLTGDSLYIAPFE
ncbi:MAG: hypothetical protein QF570_13965 [Myxococcota bacterium]|nr:hypothetical protein [Myxococcota bacterium]